jgi:hypothetical protein
MYALNCDLMAETDLGHQAGQLFTGFTLLIKSGEWQECFWNVILLLALIPILTLLNVDAL